jgi:hypothetical protein
VQAELYNALWASCDNELHGGMDPVIAATNSDIAALSRCGLIRERGTFCGMRGAIP